MFNHRLINLVGAAMFTFAAAPAFAVTGDGDWRCEWISFSTSPSGSCYGSENPPPNDGLAAINGVFGTTYTDVYKDSIIGAGSSVPLYFDAVSTGVGAGTITFATDFTDPFVLVVKLGQGWSAYTFDTDFLAGSTLSWSPNAGFDFTATTGLGLSHVAIYSTSVEPGEQVPEPGTLALLGLGLAGIATLRRRRQ